MTTTSIRQSVISSFFGQDDSFLPYRRAITTGAQTVWRKLHVLGVEGLANFTHVTPNTLRWFWQRNITREISCERLDHTIDQAMRTAYLFKHGTGTGKNTPILFLHGEHSHPFTTRHLADMVKTEKVGAIYSLALPYDDLRPEFHRTLLEKAIERIKETTREDGRFRGVIVVGHSRGSIEGAYEAFIKKNRWIRAVVSIAGRFKVTPEAYRACRKTLKPTVQAIAEARLGDQPIYTIAAERDWCISPVASTVRKDPQHHRLIKGAMHLNVLYHPETLSTFRTFLRDILE